MQLTGYKRLYLYIKKDKAQTFEMCDYDTIMT